jgi:hypothetical protein
MAYDLVVGVSNKVKDNPEIVGSIEFNELPYLAALVKMKDSFFLQRISNFWEDQRFSPEELEQAREHLHSLLLQKLKSEERNLLHKLIAVVSYAVVKKQNLFGVAD